MNLKKNPFDYYSHRHGFTCDLITFPEAAALRFEIYPSAAPPFAHTLSQTERKRILRNLTRGKTDNNVIVKLKIGDKLQFFDHLPALLDDKLFLETVFNKSLPNFMELCRRFRNVFLTKGQQQIP